ncbi:hypothetical protein ACOSQ3_017781 [Xanthoceras sorbifolium]
MEALIASYAPSLFYIPKPLHDHKTHFTKPNFINFHQSSPIPSWSFSSSTYKKNTPGPFKVFTISSPPSSSSTVSTENTPPPPEPELETDNKEEKFDWFSEWYPVMPVCDLDKRVPHGKKVLGIDIVVWWDKNENSWKVFDDACPHRLAPLSDGRIDKLGRLQCAYHGWCFNGSGDCKLIPQAPLDGPQVHTFKKACARAYPSVVQHEMVWFWPNTDPEYKDIITKKKPPFIPEMDDPSFSKFWINRDIPYGYEVLLENILDPAHVPYAHYGVMEIDQPPKVKVDREGGKPLDIVVEQLDINGFSGKHLWDSAKFVAPCTYYNYNDPVAFQSNILLHGPPPAGTDHKKKKLVEQQRMLLFFFCIPVSPGNSRLIWGIAKNFNSWNDNIIPRWIRHIVSNIVVDSDLHLLHIEEQKIMEVGPANWHKACFVPTKSDAFVVGFRRWLNKYSDGQINWGVGKFSSGTLPPTPPRQQLMDRYWSHVVNCRSCSCAYKSLNALEVVLQVVSIVSIGIAAATKQNAISATARTAMVSMAVIGFAASRWLAHFIYKNFHYHDYDHTLH